MAKRDNAVRITWEGNWIAEISDCSKSEAEDFFKDWEDNLKPQETVQWYNTETGDVIRETFNASFSGRN